ncbi:efflux RND transporter periplasmic adaptor subunit [Funiculus sociatus GB2-A5]|uniref:Efflux RND transporter periplasmic adaptor subunit n=2 Tax=Cyanophyceae TaxID=3028117 RepID=A0ABV0JJH8_9CYAN|nr:efflux RND transporter periplasmic adaptor subunit [Trichocoleus sp. FACHB-6]MBD1908427.1 efflux RND transporter periplasmic adaptor subunit [Trichocoleus sp. FACHB-832]MBD2061668.1 efflux RND transporter periplasmic adaptor subunit [Trichocoleus sp. FACHB-6]
MSAESATNQKTQQEGKSKSQRMFLLPFAFLLLPYLSSCGILPQQQADAQAPQQQQRGGAGGITPVDVAIARTDTLQEEIKFIGTTRPVREVSVQPQVEGRLLSLKADVGDRVAQGQIVAQLDDTILLTNVNQAQAELATLQSEVARARTQVGNARTQVEQAKAQLQQAQRDAARLAGLARQGAIAQQQAELAQTEAQTAQQALLSAQAQVSTEQQAVVAAQGRVKAQQSVLAQSRERQSYSVLTSPISGVVVSKGIEPGDLANPGSEILKIGDFSRVTVVVPVSELELSKIRVGQSVRVQLDAFANREFLGEVVRISPAANVAARQIPVEVTIANPKGEISSGLLARVSFSSTASERVLVPQTALQEKNPGGRGGASSPTEGQGSREARSGGSATAPEQARNSTSQIENPKSSQATVFVLDRNGKQPTVQARSVTVGDRANGKVEILSGLKPGERFVSRSGKPLKDGEPVRLSVLSETQ